MDYSRNKNYRKGKKIILSAACLVILAAGAIGVYQYKSRPKSSVRTAIVHKDPGAQYISTKTLPMSTQAMATQGYNDTAQAALVMNGYGHVLYGKNIDEQRKVASTAKLMTLYLAQAKANRTHGWHDKVQIPNNLAQMSSDAKDGTGAAMHLHDGQDYTVEDLYKSALVESSNAAAVALGEWVGGTNRNFVHLMNVQAKAWHLQAHFISASGLENDSISKFGLKLSGTKSAGNSMSARDLAVIAQHLLHDFPSITQWSSKKSMKVDGSLITNINNDLPGQIYSTPGCDGLKTGYTPSAGFCFVGTRKQGKGHDIVVLLGDDGLNIFRDGRALLLNKQVTHPEPHHKSVSIPEQPTSKPKKNKKSKSKPKRMNKHRRQSPRNHMKRNYRRMTRKQKKNS